MKSNRITMLLTWIGIALAIWLVQAETVWAHCDGLDGPVVTAAKQALETGDVNLVLIWVQKPDEAEIKNAFAKTLAVRKLSPEAREMADLYFYETLVRIHRAGEGAPYTGLKPAGQDLGPAIPAADEAIEHETSARLIKLITETVAHGIQEHFQQAVAKKNYAGTEVESGREFVRAYVTFIHYVENIYQAAQNPTHGHAPDAHSMELKHEEH